MLVWFTWLRMLWVDGGYTGATFAQWVKRLRPKLAVEVVKRSDAVCPELKKSPTGKIKSVLYKLVFTALFLHNCTSN